MLIYNYLVVSHKKYLPFKREYTIQIVYDMAKWIILVHVIYILYHLY